MMENLRIFSLIVDLIIIAVCIGIPVFVILKLIGAV